MLARRHYGLLSLSFMLAIALASACGSSEQKRRAQPGSNAGEGGGGESTERGGEAPGSGPDSGAPNMGGVPGGAAPSEGGAAGDGGSAPSGGAATNGGAAFDGGGAGASGAGGSGPIACDQGYALRSDVCVPRSCAGLAGTECDGGDCCASAQVTGGTFYRGTDLSYPATVSDFSLDVLEVTVGRFKQFVSAYAGPPAPGAGAHPSIPGSGWDAAWNSSLPAAKEALTAAVQCDATYQTWSAGTANDQRPMTCVSWFEAFAFCAWDGGWLPTEAEWEYAAAGGSDERLYPWGDAPIPTNKQDATTAYASYGGLADGSAYLSFSAADMLTVGSKPSGVGKYRQLDLSGSVWEWTLDWYAPYTNPCTNCSNLVPAAERVLRGGSAYYAALGLAAANRDKNLPTAFNNDYGFRCARK